MPSIYPLRAHKSALATDTRGARATFQKAFSFPCYPTISIHSFSVHFSPPLARRGMAVSRLDIHFRLSLSSCAGGVSYRLPRCKMPCLACSACLACFVLTVPRGFTHTLLPLSRWSLHMSHDMTLYSVIQVACLACLACQST